MIVLIFKINTVSTLTSHKKKNIITLSGLCRNEIHYCCGIGIYFIPFNIKSLFCHVVLLILVLIC